MNVPFRHLQKASNSLSQAAQDVLSSQSDIPPKVSYFPGPGPNEPCPENVTMFQAFEWNCPKDQKHWTRLAAAMPSLKAIGLDNMWIPPGCKGGWHGSNGYDIYDLYDLGEFQQKDSKGTKWGTKDELDDMMAVARKLGIGIYWDAVLNHKAAADFSEPCYAVKVDPKGMRLVFGFQLSDFDAFNNLFVPLKGPATPANSSLPDRTKELGKPTEIEAWTGFDFAGRNGRYSAMKYRWHHFTGTDYDHRTQTNGVFKFLGGGKKDWAKDVDDELGNYDYLMFADIDHSNPEVREDIFRWGEWIGKELGISGIRFDAVKHYSEDFLRDFIRHLDRTVGRKWFLVGEYWRDDLEVLAGYIKRMGNRLTLFDVPLVSNLARISMARKPDLRLVFKDTLALHHPLNAVTFVQNHDTQERGSLETIVTPDFMAHAHALILLRLSPAYPCVFYGDLYGILGSKSRPPACGGKLPKMILARKLYAYGGMNEYLDEKECIGWTRLGHPSHSSGAGLAVLLNASRASYAHKRMNVGKHHVGEIWTDIMSWAWGEVCIDKEGWGTFPVGPRSVGVWVNERAEGRRGLDHLIFHDDIYRQNAYVTS